MKKQLINDQLFNSLGHSVMTGPFAGMWIDRNVIHDPEGSIGTKLIGCYDFDLHPAIERMIERRPKCVFNIGCGDGYYAVGMARRLPYAHVYAMDIDPRSEKLCQQNAKKNECHVTIDIDDFDKIDAESCLIVERNEMLLFGKKFRNLSHCDVIVKCRDFMNMTIHKSIQEQLKDTHDFELIEYRDNVMEKHDTGYPFLSRYTTSFIKIATTEIILKPATYLICWRKD